MLKQYSSELLHFFFIIIAKLIETYHLYLSLTLTII